MRGAWGERAAADFLVRKGYSLIARNYRTRQGEIDLIVSDVRYLVFVEVKTRKSARFCAAREAVDERKQRRLILAAEQWMQAHPTALQARMDVVEVYGPEAGPAYEIHHFENAFDA